MTKGVGSFLFLALAVATYGQSAVIKEIVVRGNERVQSEAIRAAMRSAEGRPYIESELERDRQSLYNLGVFKDVKIFGRPLNDTEVQVIVDVAENPVIKEISVIGNSVIKTEDILKVVTQQKDQLLNLNSRRPTADAIRALYDSKGYFAEVDFPTNPDQPGSMVIMVIETTVNDIVITGLTRTRKRVLDRLIKTEIGKPLNEVTWANDFRRVNSTQWFERIQPGIRPAQEIGKVDLLLDLKETRTARFDVGVALDPRSKLAGTFRISDTNFRGQGQTFGASLQQDTFGSGASATLDFTDPFYDRFDTTMTAQVYSRVNNYFADFGTGSSLNSDERFDERRTGASLSFTRPIKGIDFTLGTQFDTVEAVNLSLRNPTYVRQDGQVTKFLIQASRDRRDVPLDPFEGDFFRASIEPGISKINKIGGEVASYTDALGTNSFMRTTVEYKAFFSKRPADRRKLSDPRPVLATRARFGTITGTVPFYEQLFVGGSDSLRGYPDQRFWGKTALSGSLEMRIPAPGTDALTMVGFIDYGGAWGGYSGISTFDQSSAFKMHLGYGAGLGFRTPLGLIRVDFGFTPEGKSRTHFTVGGTF